MVDPTFVALRARTDSYRGPDAHAGAPYVLVADVLFSVQGGALTLSIDGAPNWLSLTGELLSGTPDGPGVHAFDLIAETATDRAVIRVTIPILADDLALGENWRMLTYNAWYRGTHVPDGGRKELDLFISSGADVIALQESSDTHARKAAEALGWPGVAGEGDHYVISRYPIVDTRDAPAAHAGLVSFDAGHRRAVWVWSAHLGYQYYGPYGARDGHNVEEVIFDENRERAPEARGAIAVMDEMTRAAPRIPHVYAGDMNAPSHLDWTEATSEKNFGLTVPWPVSTALEEAGFIDTYREIHRDPVIDPGLSWTPRFPGEPQDRIDFIHARGDALATTDSVYLGPEALPGWASDHGAFVTQFRWRVQMAESGPSA